MFFTTPMMIHGLGKEDYGIWLLAIAIVAYFRLLDLGVSFAGSRFLGAALGSEDRREYRSLVSKLYRLYLQIGLASLVLTVLVVLVTPYFISQPGMAFTIRILVGGFGLATALRFFTRIYEVILKSHVRYDFIGISSILKTLLQAGFVIGLLQAGYGLITLLVAHILIDVFDQLLLVYFAKRVESNLLLRESCEGEIKTSELLRYSASMLLTVAGQSLRQGIDPIVITRVSGVSALPQYNVGFRFIGVLTDLVNAIFGGNFIAAFSQLHGRGNCEVLNDRFMQTIRYSTVVATFCGSGLMIFGPAFIQRWVGSDFVLSGYVIWILTPVTILFLCQYPVESLLASQNKQHWLALITLVGGVFNLILSLYLSSRIGWIGVVWATCVEMGLVFGLGIPWLVTRVCSVSMSKYFWQIMGSGSKIVVVSTVYWLGARNFILPAYDRLLLLGFAYFAFISISVWLVIFTKSERDQFWNAIKVCIRWRVFR